MISGLFMGHGTKIINHEKVAPKPEVAHVCRDSSFTNAVLFNLQSNPSRDHNFQLFTPHSSLLGKSKSISKVSISFVTDPTVQRACSHKHRNSVLLWSEPRTISRQGKQLPRAQLAEGQNEGRFLILLFINAHILMPQNSILIASVNYAYFVCGKKKVQLSELGPHTDIPHHM
jgi:hypothetical protein